MKSIFLTISLFAIIGTGTYVFAYGMGMGEGWHYGGNSHSGMMNMGGECDQKVMDNVQMKVVENNDGVTIKMTSKDKDQIKLIKQHAKLMQKNYDNN